jgi:hypothetical protein
VPSRPSRLETRKDSFKRDSGIAAGLLQFNTEIGFDSVKCQVHTDCRDAGVL